jgi:hypothetical protein
LPRLIHPDDIRTGRIRGLGFGAEIGGAAVDHVALSLAVFLGGLVSGFSGFAFSAAAGVSTTASFAGPYWLCSSSQAA